MPLVPTRALAPLSPAAGLANADLMALLLADKRSAATRRAYEGDWKHFHLTTRPDLDAFARELFLEDMRAFLAATPPEVGLRLLRYKSAMLDAGLAEATVNRRLAAVRSLLKFAYRLGLAQTDGRNLVDGEKVRAYRDTRGIAPELVKELFTLPARAHPAGSIAALRDEAMLRVLALNGLRRAEVHQLDVRDFSYAQCTLAILGKGRGSQKETVSVVPSCADAIARYLLAAGHKGDFDGPLFRNLDHRPDKADGRLTTRGIHWLVAGYGARIGITNLRPHQLRHTAITQLSKRSNGNIPAIKAFSRHADANTVLIYVDNAKEEQKRMTELLEEAYS